MWEERLTTNEQHPILRIGDTVHRPVDFWTPAVHSLLGYLAARGLSAAPRVIGRDGDSREVLSFLPGQSGQDGWKQVVSEDGLRAFARLLRRYHDVVADFRPPADLEWSTGARGLNPGDIICHGDFGPWNVVWQEGVPTGLLDWDMAHPAPPEHDILYALEYTAPFRDDEAAVTWHAFPTPPDRRRRVGVFLTAYGHPPIPHLAAKVAAMQREVAQHEAYLAVRGVQPQADLVEQGQLEELERRTRWSEEHGELFEAIGRRP
ncbi:MAG: aminoglycoside phosphotransferase family protein [Clostridia bacterium]